MHQHRHTHLTAQDEPHSFLTSTLPILILSAPIIGFFAWMFMITVTFPNQYRNVTGRISTVMNAVNTDPDATQLRSDMNTRTRAHLEATPSPPYAAALRAALFTGGVTACFTPRTLITSQEAGARYLDGRVPGWRELERRLSSPSDPKVAARLTKVSGALSGARELTGDIRNGGDRQMWRERINALEDDLTGHAICVGPAFEERRVQLLLTGLRDTRLNQPAQALNLSRTAPEGGLSDADLLCLSGSADLTHPIVVAGEELIAPDGQELPLPRPAPALVKLRERLITPADLQSAGCTLERQTELASRVRAMAALGR